MSDTQFLPPAGNFAAKWEGLSAGKAGAFVFAAAPLQGGPGVRPATAAVIQDSLPVAYILDPVATAGELVQCKTISGNVIQWPAAIWEAITDEDAELTTGAIYYLSATTAGNITKTPPSGAGDFVVPVGVALSPIVLLPLPGIAQAQQQAQGPANGTAAARLTVAGGAIAIANQSGQFASAAYLAPGQFTVTLKAIAGVTDPNQIIAVATTDSPLIVQQPVVTFSGSEAVINIRTFSDTDVATDPNYFNLIVAIL